MFGNPYNSGLSFTKILTGISKTLNVANQVIPLYQEAKPMINNAKNIFNVLKDIGKKDTTSPIKNNIKKDAFKQAPINNNNPRFFQ